MLTSIAYLALLQAKPQKLAPAVFADASARRIVNFSRSAYSKLKSAKFVIDSNGAKKTYLYSNGKLYGHQAGAEWQWSAKKLRLLCSKGLFSGNMGIYNVNAWLAKVGADPETLPIQIAAKKNPIDVLIPPGSRVRRSGTMALNGTAVDVIEVKSSRLRVTMAIRQDNRLIADLNASNVDKDGSVLFRSSRSISWSNVNRPLSIQTVGAGKSAKSIKTLK